jgi:hypothetical protein
VGPRHRRPAGPLNTVITRSRAVGFSKPPRRGVTLYLASGTDHTDVSPGRGYACLFNGGIFGAPGDITFLLRKWSSTGYEQHHLRARLAVQRWSGGLREIPKRDGSYRYCQRDSPSRPQPENGRHVKAVPTSARFFPKRPSCSGCSASVDCCIAWGRYEDRLHQDTTIPVAFQQ